MQNGKLLISLRGEHYSVNLCLGARFFQRRSLSEGIYLSSFFRPFPANSLKFSLLITGWPD